MSDETPGPKPFAEQSPDELWESAKRYMREQGEDPDAVLAKAAANLAAWRALPEEERERQLRASTDEWLAWEATVDDMGNPIDFKKI